MKDAFLGDTDKAANALDLDRTRRVSTSSKFAHEVFTNEVDTRAVIDLDNNTAWTGVGIVRVGDLTSKERQDIIAAAHPFGGVVKGWVQVGRCGVFENSFGTGWRYLRRGHDLGLRFLLIVLRDL